MRIVDQDAAVAAHRQQLRSGVLMKGSCYLTWTVAGRFWESTSGTAGNEAGAR
ncbi:hypothetical protein ACFQO7_06805 [Catellatospora aurea]|uniref:Uncharacterized protein n=1 Tax=Catellatospora aurea TaxID=1337874 RepID=A0ABW2GQH4_9ACTN